MVIESSILEHLATFGIVVYKVKGKSMEPMLVPDRDIVTIKRLADSKLSENDVVLYYRKGKLKLHRIVGIKEDGLFVILGDNCSGKEYDICRENVVGVMTSFVHNGVHYQAYDKAYLKYVRTLRENEGIRIKKKHIIDFVSWHLRFLPTQMLASLKAVLRFLLNYKMSFPE